MRRIPALLIAVFVLFGCYHEKDYSPTDPGVLLFSVAGSDVAPADGNSRIHLTARITPEAASTKRTIVFTTSAGTLLGGTGTSATEKSVDVDISGVARIDLQAPTTAQSVTVTARVKDQPIAQQLALTFTPVKPEALVQFVAAPASAPADGATESLFTVFVPNSQNLEPAQRNVTFSTTAGKLLPEATGTNSVPINAAGQASVSLRSSEVATTGIVRATFSGGTAETRIEFTTALPELIELTPDKVVLEAKFADSVIIHAKLRRHVGKVTIGTFVTFHATTSAGAAIGLFRDQRTATDGNGDASTTFTAGDTPYRGAVTITATVDGTSVIGTTTVQVVAPAGT
jgi:hypothetical protein